MTALAAVPDPFKLTELIRQQTTVRDVLTNISNSRAVNLPELANKTNTIVKFTQLCNKFLPTALLNFSRDWLALDRDMSFGRLTSPNV